MPMTHAEELYLQSILAEVEASRPRVTVHDESAKPSAIARALTDYTTAATVSGACNARVRHQLSVVLRLLDGGHVTSARALVDKTMRDLGGAL